jgi:hypothetical protein
MAQDTINPTPRSSREAVPPLQPDRHLPAPIWICPTCEKLMRIGTIEVANGEEHTKLACATCGTEATQIKDVV